jgi:hypothetical protein
MKKNLLFGWWLTHEPFHIYIMKHLPMRHKFAPAPCIPSIPTVFFVGIDRPLPFDANLDRRETFAYKIVAHGCFEAPNEFGVEQLRKLSEQVAVVIGKLRPT